MDIVNNIDDFHTAAKIFCALNASYWIGKHGKCNVPACPINKAKCSEGAPFEEYSHEDRELVAQLYEKAHLPDDPVVANVFLHTLRRATYAMAFWSDRVRSEENAAETAKNDAVSPVKEEEHPVKAENPDIIRIRRNPYGRPELYVRDQPVDYGRNFTIEGDVDGTLQCDFMGVRV